MGLGIINVSHLRDRGLEPSLPGLLSECRSKGESAAATPPVRAANEVILVGPNARNFTVQQAEQVGSYVCALVNYPDANNYEGNKVMLLEGIEAEQLNGLSELDPHFQADGIVIARFRPDEEGWQDAIALAQLKSQRQD